MDEMFNYLFVQNNGTHAIVLALTVVVLGAISIVALIRTPQ